MMRQLFYLLVPIGLALFIGSVRATVRLARTEKLFALPCREQQGDFSLTEAGIYGLWLSGKNYTPVSIGTFGLELCNLANGEKVPLRAVLLRTAVTGFSRARVELYTFRAEAGRYQLTVTGKGLLRDQPVGGLLRALRPQACNLSACDVEIYRHSPVIWLFLSICGIIAGSFFLLGGILLPLLLQSSM